MEFLDLLRVNADSITAVGIIVGVCWLVITRKLVWHTDLDDERERTDMWRQRADDWEATAWDALSQSTAPSVKAVEVAADVIAALPHVRRGKD